MSDINYKATVVVLKNIRKHDNADRLQCTTIFGNNIIVGLDAKPGDKGLYFPLESQIGLEFAQANDLLRRKDENGKPAGGMFDENRRVRAQTFRGEKSMGFWIPIDSLKKLEQGFDTQIDDLTDGEELEQFNGRELATKYVPKNSRTPSQASSSKNKSSKASRLVEGQFNFHKDTLQLGKNLHQIKPNDLIAVTYKYHGTSAIASRVLVRRKKDLKDKIKSFIDWCFREEQNYLKYDYLYASRTVVKNDSLNPGGYYNEDLWTATGKKYFEGNLKEGETIYYEIVGYTEGGREIQKGYNYGAKVGESYPIIYRITYTLMDGTVIELPWHLVEERAKQLNVKSALTLYYGEAVNYGELGSNFSNIEEWQDAFLKKLQEEYLEKDCIFHNKGVAAEGICVRRERLDLTTFKLKSFRFFEHETKLLDKGEEDIESQQSE